MRNNLIDELRKVAGECTIDSYPDILEVRNLLYEAADALEELHKIALEKLQKTQTPEPKVTYLNGNDILNQIDNINRKRAKEGMPPI